MHVALLGTNTVETSSTTGTITVGTAVPTGHTVLGAVAWSQDATSIPSASVTDSRGHTYSVDIGAGTGNSTASVAIFRALVTTPLQVGDTITVTIGAARIRWCLQADCFDDVLASSPLDQTAANHNPASSTSMSTGTTGTTTQARELLYGAWAWGRGSDQNITGVGGWSSTSQVVTANAATKRGLQVAYTYTSTTGTQTGTATVSAATTYAGALATYLTTARPGPARATLAAVHRAATW